MLLPCLKNGRIIISYETFMKGPSPTSHPSGMNYKKGNRGFAGGALCSKTHNAKNFDNYKSNPYGPLMDGDREIQI